MSKPLHVVFVCTGNICRSPMAERVAEAWAAEEGLDGVTFSSRAVSDEELGSPIDPRAREILSQHGYRTDDHRSRQVTASDVLDADLVVALEPHHARSLRRLAPTASSVVLLTDFDPYAAPGSGVPDPWYGDKAGFRDTLAAIEAAMPGLLERVRSLLSG